MKFHYKPSVYRTYAVRNTVRVDFHSSWLLLCVFCSCLTLTLLTWTIWRAPTNASKWRMGFNSAFKGLTIFRDKNLSALSSDIKSALLLKMGPMCYPKTLVNKYSRTSIIRTSITRNVKYLNPHFLRSTFKQRKISDFSTQ